MTVLVGSKFLENIQTVQYVSEAAITTINKATCTNVSTEDVEVDFHLVNSGGSISSSNQIIKDRTLKPNQTYQCPELIGHDMNSGDYLSAGASVSPAIVFRMSGSKKTNGTV